MNIQEQNKETKDSLTLTTVNPLKDITLERLIELLPEDLYSELVSKIAERESYVLVVKKDIYSTQYPEIIKHYLIPKNVFNKYFDFSDKRCSPKNKYYNEWDKYPFSINIDKPIIGCYIYVAGL